MNERKGVLKIEQLILELGQFKNIIIYGAGMVGALVYKCLKLLEMENRIDGFAVSDKKDMNEYMGKPVYGIEELLFDKNTTVIIVAVMPDLQKEIVDIAHTYGVIHTYCIEQELYKELSQFYIQKFLERKVIHRKQIDILFMASDNNCTSGAFLCMAELNQELNRKGITSLVVLPEYGNGESVLEEKNIEYTYVVSEDWTIPIEYPDIIKKKRQLQRNVEAVKRLENLISEHQIKIIHNNTIYTYIGAVAAKNKNIPVVWHIRENIFDQGNQFLDSQQSINLINESDQIVAISGFMAGCVDGLDKNRLNIVYDGVDANKFYLERPVFKNILQVTILMVGAVTEYKGQMDLIKAINSLKKRNLGTFKIWFAGKGDSDYVKKLEKIVDQYELQNQISFLGRQDNVAKLYHQADIAVVCSKAEPFGRVTIEAQLAGCLVIGADTGATPELIEHCKTGLLYRQGDINDLADKIKYAMDNPLISQKLALNGQKNAYMTYTKERNAEEIIKIYDKILNEEK